VARVEIGEVVQDITGQIIGGASVQVNVRGGGAATVYSAETGGVTLANPLLTDANGRIEGWLEEGSYDLVVSHSGVSYTQRFEASAGKTTKTLLRRSHAPFANGAVCFTWDDGYDDHFTEVAVRADDLAQRHTFCVTTDLLNGAGRLTSSQVAELYSRGHEIADHSKDHADLTTLSVAQRVSNYSASLAALEAIVGTGNVTTYVYPFGARTSTTDAELFLRYRRVRGIGQLASTGSYPPWLVTAPERNDFLVGALSWGTVGQPNVLGAIRLAAQAPVIVVIYGHEIGTDPPLADLIEAMNLCSTLNVPCLTLAEAFPGGNLLRDSGFESGDLTQWPATVSSGGAATVVTDTPVTGFAGSKSLRLTGTADTSVAYVSQLVPVEPGQAYTLSGRYRSAITSGSVGQGVYARIRERTYDGQAVGQSVTGALTASSWTQFSVTRTMAATGRFALVDFVLDQRTAEVFVDHLCFQKQVYGAPG
jgi:peptidoglycan/xylan/chitin deacetylase (PgdA/CDA1 family)